MSRTAIYRSAPRRFRRRAFHCRSGRCVDSLGARTDAFYVPGETGIVAQITYKGGLKSARYFVNDHLGNTAVVHGTSAGATERSDYAPFGARVDAAGLPASDPNPITTLGFTGHEDDDYGLVNMNGRIYDPARYRFLSPDPYITRPLFSESRNPYSYVMNSPLSFTDPSGFEDESIDGGSNSDGTSNAGSGGPPQQGSAFPDSGHSNPGGGYNYPGVDHGGPPPGPTADTYASPNYIKYDAIFGQGLDTAGLGRGSIHTTADYDRIRKSGVLNKWQTSNFCRPPRSAPLQYLPVDLREPQVLDMPSGPKATWTEVQAAERAVKKSMESPGFSEKVGTGVGQGLVLAYEWYNVASRISRVIDGTRTILGLEPAPEVPTAGPVVITDGDGNVLGTLPPPNFRPGLWQSTQRIVEKQGRRGFGAPVKPNQPMHIGHLPGHENKPLVMYAREIQMPKEVLVAFINANPQFFFMQTGPSNSSRRMDLGYLFPEVKDAMQKFLKEYNKK